MSVKKITTPTTKSGHAWRIRVQVSIPGAPGKIRRQEMFDGSHRDAIQREAALRLELAEALEAKLDPAAANIVSDDTFADFAHHWLLQRRDAVKPSTLRGYDQMLRVHAVTVLGPRRLRELRPLDIEHYLQGLRRRERPLAVKTINNHLGMIKTLLDDAVDNGFIERNPAKKIRPRPATPSGAHIIITGPQMPAFHKGCLVAAGNAAPVLLTMLYTGLRLGEAAALEWPDLDLDGHTLHVRRSRAHGSTTTPKSSKTRVVPLPAQLVEVLKTLPRNHTLVFPYRPETSPRHRPIVKLRDDPHLDSNRLRHPFKRALKAAGLLPELEGMRLHDLRHSFCSYLSNSGTPPDVVRTLAGHAELSTTLRYFHTNLADKRRAVASFPSVDMATE